MSTLRIGTIRLDNNLILAPMAGITDTCCRRIATQHGAGLVCSEMISASGLRRGSLQSHRIIRCSPEEGPLSVQLFGADPAELAEAARIAEGKGASVIDINMGCPVRTVCRIGAGAALLLDTVRVGRILRAVREAISCPLTVKIRAGWDEARITAPEIARIAEENGVDAVIIHPRTKTQGFRGRADWDLVARIKQEREVPIIGNGDIVDHRGAKQCLESTGCDGIMIGRAARGDPWLFSRINGYLESGTSAAPPCHQERKYTMFLHLELALTTYGAAAALQKMRKHFSWYVKGLPGAVWFREQLHTRREASSIRSLVEEYFERHAVPTSEQES